MPEMSPGAAALLIRAGSRIAEATELMRLCCPRDALDKNLDGVPTAQAEYPKGAAEFVQLHQAAPVGECLASGVGPDIEVVGGGWLRLEATLDEVGSLGREDHR